MMLRPSVAGAVAGLLALVPVSAHAAGLVNEWGNPANVAVDVVGDIAAAPGLEGVGTDPFTAMKVVISLDDGSTFGLLPGTYSSPNTTCLLRDIDEDGLAEIIAIFDGFNESPRIGVIDFGTQGLQLLYEMFPYTQPTSIEVERFTAQAPPSLVILTNYLTVVRAVDGQLEYDSESALGPAWLLLSAVTNDFDGDSEPEILASFRNFSTNEGQTILLGANTTPTSVSPGDTRASAVLGQNMPNPSSGSTEIRFRLNETAPVRLRVFDAAGRVVRTLVDEVRGAGGHQLVWDGRDDSGRAVGSGVYFYELAVPGEKVGRKMMVVR